jgi:hypothetical protein
MMSSPFRAVAAKKRMPTFLVKLLTKAEQGSREGFLRAL